MDEFRIPGGRASRADDENQSIAATSGLRATLFRYYIPNSKVSSTTFSFFFRYKTENRLNNLVFRAHFRINTRGEDFHMGNSLNRLNNLVFAAHFRLNPCVEDSHIGHSLQTSYFHVYGIND